MSEYETILKVLRHCMKEECFGCPYRGSKSCTRRMATSAKQAIEQLIARVTELEARDIGEHGQENEAASER